MDEQTLPERLRELANSHGAGTVNATGDVAEALRGAADELERLTVSPFDPYHAPDVLAARLLAESRNSDHADSTREVFAVAAATVSHLFEALEHELARPQPAPGTLAGQLAELAEARSVAGAHEDAALLAEAADTLVELARHARRLERNAHPLHTIGAELAGDGGVAVPMPRPLRVGARFVPPTDTPSPGSFVFAGPALAVWRVLNVERLPEPAGGEVVTEPRPTHALDLEPVDVHDVPIAARVAEVPFPVVTLEVVDGVSSDAG